MRITITAAAAAPRRTHADMTLAANQIYLPIFVDFFS